MLTITVHGSCRYNPLIMHEIFVHNTTQNGSDNLPSYNPIFIARMLSIRPIDYRSIAYFATLTQT